MPDKRQFTRVPLSVTGNLTHNNQHIDVVISDVSLQGIKLCITESALNKLALDDTLPHTVAFRINEDSPIIRLRIEQRYSHLDNEHAIISLGCKFAQFDVDSISMLRRLILLNSHDDYAPEKELNTFINSVYSSASNASDN